MNKTPDSRQRPRWGRRIALGTAVFMALVILAFVAFTSSVFLRKVVLPRVGKAMDSKISVSQLDFHPFSGLVARDVKVVPNGAEPIVELAELRLRYTFGSFLAGKPEINDITLVGPKVQIIQKADGTSNLTPIQKALEKLSKVREPKPQEPASASVFSLKAVTLEGGTFRFSSQTTNRGSEAAGYLLDTTFAANFDLESTQGGQTIETKGKFRVGKLRVGPLAPTTPEMGFEIGFHVAIDSVSPSVVLKQFKLSLPPTHRAGNELLLTGTVDLGSRNPRASQMNLSSDAIDLTEVMAFLTDASSGMTSKRAEGSGEEKVSMDEPPAMNLPIANLNADVRLGKLFMRDLGVSNLVSVLKVQTNVLRLDPFQLVCNGASLSTTSHVDLSKPGYVYDVRLSAENIPVEPLANSFAPAYKGMAQGDLSAFADFRGAGITRPSLLTNLYGKVDILFTNANIQLVGPKIKRMLTPIAMLLRVPELLNSPMNGFEGHVELTKGALELRQIELRTEAFQANTSGTIPLQLVLTNSPLNLPIVIALRRSIAQKSNLMTAGAQGNAAFVTLPVFATVKGTLGAPETKTDALVLAGLGLKSVAGLPLGAGEKVGNILGGIGKILTGEKSAPPATDQNSQPKTNAPSKVKPLDLLKLIPEKKEKKP